MSKKISIAKLHLYIDNPRLPHAETEEEALYYLIENQRKKLLTLAKDIALHGLSPLDLIAVFPDSHRKGHYFVAEGNRRVSALKLLDNPALIAERIPSLAKAFEKIEISPEIDISTVIAEVYPSEDDPELVRILEQRHLGEQNGVGVVAWNATQKERFYALHHGNSTLLSFLDDLISRGILTKEQVSSVTKTNWERILRPIGLDFLKLKKENSLYVIPEENLSEFSQKIKLIADKLSGQTVAVVYSTDEIKKFLSEIEEEYISLNGDSLPNASPLSNPDHQPDKSGLQFEDPPSQLEDPTSRPEDPDPQSTHPGCLPVGPNTQSGGEDIPADDDEYHPSIPKNPYLNCKTVIPKSLRLQSRNARVGKIIDELKRLPVEEYPNACGSLLRLLIELSAKVYVEHHGIEEDATRKDFSSVISSTIYHLQTEEKIEKYYARSIRQAQDAARQLFDGHMHNTDSYPSTTVIKETFKTFEKFIKLCLE